MERKILLKISQLFLTIWAGMLLSQQSVASTTDPSRFQPQIFPPSPEAFKLGSYGNTPVGMFTGTPNIDIPIMSFNAGDIKIPILINYSSNGIKVDEFSGKAGLGWKFIAGGVITRVIRGIPDEKGQNPGHFVNPPNLDSLKTEDGAVRKFLVEATSGGVDAEPDMYHATFADASFSFVFDKWGNARILSLKNITIEGTSGGSSFTVTLENGFKYFFSIKEKTMNRVMGAGHTIPSTNVTAWYLSKIADTNGTEVYFEYESDDSDGITSQNQTMSMTIPGASYSVIGTNGNCVNGWSLPPTIPAPISHAQQITGQRLIMIYSNRPKYGEIRLTYQKLFGDDSGQISEIKKVINSNNIESYSFSFVKTAPQDRAYLDNIVDNKTGKKYLFEYINPLLIPQRLSFSRDQWGYFNGKTNYNLIPKLTNVPVLKNVTYDGSDQDVDIVKTQVGLLSKIIYPTGGYTIINYEPNTIKATQIYKSPKTAKQLQVWRKAKAGAAAGNKPIDTVTFYNAVAQNMYIGLSGDFNSDDCDSSQDTGFHHVASISGKMENGSYLSAPAGGSFCPGWPDPPAGMQTGSTVRGNSVTCFAVPQGNVTFELQADFRCTIGSSFINYALPDIEKIENVPVGGSRVAKTITYESLSSVPIIISYKYDGADNFTTGVQVRAPYFIDRTTNGALCSTSNGELPLVHLSSNNFRSLNASHPNIFYEQVTEYKNGGSIVHKYSKETDIYGNIEQGSGIVSAPWTNIGWLNGKELSTSYYDSNSTLLRKVENNYEEDLKRQSVIIGLSLRKDYDLDYLITPKRKCWQPDVQTKYSDYECTATHQHIWYNGKCVAAGANNILRTTYDECYGQPLGTEFTHNDIFENVSIMQYKNISRFDYLKSQKTTDYLGGNPVKTETQYFYENPGHYQQTKQLQTGADNSSQLTDYTYALEENDVNMLATNMVGIPLQTEIKENGKVISKTKTVYGKSTQTNNLILPVMVQDFNQDNFLSAKMAISYDQYDEKGNLLQYTTKGGVPIAVIWGYDNTLPIAKIEGATYQEAVSYASDIILKSNGDIDDSTEQSLLVSEDAYKTHPALKNYKITTYTYNPLIGITSMIPPSGVRVYYKYDAAGRLQSVVDVNNNILKELKYNYKH